jgi:uncharacterized protein YbbK (DUF523 family)
LVKEGKAISVCPELLGGLPTPRAPSEICGKRILAIDGTDFTTAFHDGVLKAVAIAKENNCTSAILKSKSPSCGLGKVFDGSFRGRLIDGNGVLADALVKMGIKVTVIK